MYRYKGEQRYDGGASKREKKGISGFVKFLIVVFIIGVISLAGYYGYRHFKNKGYGLGSFGKVREPESSVSVDVINANDAEMTGHTHSRPSPLSPSRGQHTSLRNDNSHELELKEMS